MPIGKGLNRYRKATASARREVKRQRDDAWSMAVLRRLVEVNPGLENMTCGELHARLAAYIEDIKDGRAPTEPFVGLDALMRGEPK